MKKVTILKASILFLAIASFHLFSIPHAFDIGHHYKAVADQQEMHEMKAGQMLMMRRNPSQIICADCFMGNGCSASDRRKQKYGILPQAPAEKKLYTGQILSIVLFRQTSCSTSPEYITKI